MERAIAKDPGEALPDFWLVCSYKDHGYSYQPDHLCKTRDQVDVIMETLHGEGRHVQVFPIYSGVVGRGIVYGRPEEES